MKLDLSVLDELVREYCIYRGIVDSGSGALSGKTQTLSPFINKLFCLLNPFAIS